MTKDHWAEGTGRSRWGAPTLPTSALAVVIAALALLTLLGGNADLGGVCAAAGRTNSVTVTTVGNEGDVEGLDACLGSGCISALPQPGRHGLLMGRIGPERWRVAVGLSAPESITIRALGAGGRTLAMGTFALGWFWTGGSGSCGATMWTEPLMLDLR